MTSHQPHSEIKAGLCPRQQICNLYFWIGLMGLQVLCFGCVSRRGLTDNLARDTLEAKSLQFSSAASSQVNVRQPTDSAKSFRVRSVKQDDADVLELDLVESSEDSPQSPSQKSQNSEAEDFQPSLEPLLSTEDVSRFGFMTDLRTMPLRVKDDVGALLTWENSLFLGTAAAGSAIIRNNVDSRIIRETDEHGPQWGHVSQVLSHGGDAFLVHVPLLAGMYATSLWQQNDDLHELTLTMFTSYKFSVLSALALQYATGTHRGTSSAFSFVQDNGFPAEPTAASFALAAVLDEKYGWKGGVPAYLVAGVIGWSEVDQGHHTVSDVAFGAALGYVIGKSIGALHYHPDSQFKLVPFIDINTGAQGLAFEMRY